MRHQIARIAAGLLALIGAAGACAAPLVDFKHVSWSIEDGAPSRINAITQSANGYLWIGSVEGLFRFDGVTFERVQPSKPRPDPIVVAAVLGAKSGDVWVGLARSGGVSVYRGGRLVDSGMPNPSREVTDLAEDRDGAIWVARGGRSRDTLARYWRGRWQEIGADWNLPEQQVWQVLFAHDGTMWVVLSDTIVRRKAGARRFEPTGITVGRRASLAEDADGRLWLADSSGTRLLPDAVATGPSWVMRYAPSREVGGGKLLFTRHGDLWATTWTDGIYRIPLAGARRLAHDGAGLGIATYHARDGLTSDQSHAVFEDREGNVWIGSELGLDMLRPASVIVEPAIEANAPRGYRMARTEDGTIYVSDTDAVYRIEAGRAPVVALRTATTAGSLCAGAGNSLWVTLEARILHVQHGAVTTIPKPMRANTFGCAEDEQGRLWLAGLDAGLFWYEGGTWRRWPGLSPSIGLPGNVARAPDGRAAILFRSVPALPSTPPFIPLFRERFAVGGIEGVLPGAAALYVGGARGLALVSKQGTWTLGADRYPWLGSVNGLVQTPTGETWTIGDAGIVRMATAQLERAFAQGRRPLSHQVFDFRDGLNSFAQKAPGMQAAVGGDGRLWFLTRRNVIRIDPAHLTRNPAPPPVLIRTVTTGAAQYRDPSAVTLPAGTTDLTIGFTALSLSVPSRVRFRYRLEGVDKDWVDGGAKREAFYGNLRPGTYRFRVIAANNDGVWNREGANVTVTIRPTFFQTWLFRALCVVAVLLLLWLLYSLRLRQVAERIRSRLEERIAERERIARELHDTLLQGVQGLVMRFQSVADHIADDHPAKQAINTALDRADQVLIEGRDRVRDLRMPDSRPLEVILHEVAGEQPFAATTTIDVQSEGVPRAIKPLILDEVVRIAGEALFNAALHAQAEHLHIRVSYERRWLTVTFRDDGVGIGTERLVRAGREGHFGLIGMHERARKIGAHLTLDSAAGRGTLVSLQVAAGIAYAARAGRGAVPPPGDTAQ